jgi:hypothetical protein
MELREIVEIADEAYGDGLVLDHHDFREKYGHADAELGDGLAEFVAVELKETYDPDATTVEQLHEASKVMLRAKYDLGNVAAALEFRLDGAKEGRV